MSERANPDLWLEPEDDPRAAAEQVPGEQGVVLGYLRHYRQTIELKCAGLDAEQLARRSVPPSTMSLLGLVRHLSRVEFIWSREVLQPDPAAGLRPFTTQDGIDLTFDGAEADEALVHEAWERWGREVEHSAQVLSGLDDWGALVIHRGQPIEVRDVMVHLVEEYARHAGHADLLRESIDGRTGQ